MHLNDTMQGQKFCECGCGQLTPIATKTNRKNGTKKGQHQRFVKGHNGRRPLPERLWGKVTKIPNGCWLWQGATYGFGYGEIHVDGKPRAAHRVSWELTYGPIPDTEQVLHRCDVPNCVCPDHLFLGSQLDNMVDMIGKGRSRAGINNARGERHGKSRINARIVREIRKLHEQGMSKQAIANRFRISRGNVGFVVAGKTWQHVK